MTSAWALVSTISDMRISPFPSALPCRTPHPTFFCQCPTYFAYSVLALSMSLVPLMIARPSGNTVNSCSSAMNFSRNLLKLTVAAHRLEVPGHLLEVQLRRHAMRRTCTALRPHRLVVCEPCSPSSHSNFLRWQQGQSTLPSSGAILMRSSDVFPHVDVDQLAVDLVPVAGQDLERLGDLEAGHDVDDRRQHAGGLAGARFARSRGRLEDAAQARRLGRAESSWFGRSCRSSRRRPTACSASRRRR